MVAGVVAVPVFIVAETSVGWFPMLGFLKKVFCELDFEMARNYLLWLILWIYLLVFY